MRNACVSLAILIVTVAGCVTGKTDAPDSEILPSETTDSGIECAQPCLRHVVLFKFKDGTPPAKVTEIEEAFAALPEKIPQICAFEWGTDMSVENLSQGFTHAFLVSFKSEDDRAVYLPHPEHKKFGELIGPHLDKVLVMDYWAQR
jgi:hypothetical protein